ncbi:MAG TPA: RcpC/CpaB family pilus assembly protein [Gaiellaceae bacterium]|nr:RcpC/CpaB family pilus assembly protein [Gaiellaceae bacterium]
MRFQRPTHVDLQPSENGRVAPGENGHVQVRLRDRDPSVSAGISVRGRVVRPLPLIGAFLVATALAGYWSIYSATTHRTPVLVAAHDLQAGTVLRPSDLRTAELAGDTETMAALVPEAELATVLGRGLAAPVSEGAPLPRATVAEAGSGPAAFTIVVPALRALAGSLRPGDRVTVLATFESGAGARARALARGLRVLTIGVPPEGLDRSSASIPVTVALPDPGLAAGLALANTEGKIDLLREGGKSANAPIPPASEQGGS